MGIKMGGKTKKIISYVVSALGAAGGALQNYSAIELLLRGLASGFNTLSSLISGMVQLVSVAGGACSGLVNFFINVDLVDGFLNRITNNKEVKLAGWRKFRYYAGLFVFTTTGVLFGMMAFAFSAATPLAILALASGLFVAVIMTIQEVETWLQSFDEPIQFLMHSPNTEDKENVLSANHVLVVCLEGIYSLGFCNKEGIYEEHIIKDDTLLSMLNQEKLEEGEIDNAILIAKITQVLNALGSVSGKKSLRDICKNWWATLTFKKACGHLIAAGNVLALSLLFTLSLFEVLVVLQVTALPALVIALAVSFTFGAFTEFYFYNFFLAKFCKTFDEQVKKMNATKYAPLGYACITINALVNAGLTYAGVGLLSGVFVLAGIAAPPLGLMIGLAVVSAVFAGSASFILGMDFWIRKLSPEPEGTAPIIENQVTYTDEVKAELTQTQEPKFTSGLCFIKNMNSEVIVDEKSIGFQRSDEVLSTLTA